MKKKIKDLTLTQLANLCLLMKNKGHCKNCPLDIQCTKYALCEVVAMIKDEELKDKRHKHYLEQEVEVDE